jgi:hypothetical protein
MAQLNQQTRPSRRGRSAGVLYEASKQIQLIRSAITNDFAGLCDEASELAKDLASPLGPAQQAVDLQEKAIAEFVAISENKASAAIIKVQVDEAVRTEFQAMHTSIERFREGRERKLRGELMGPLGEAVEKQHSAAMIDIGNRFVAALTVAEAVPRRLRIRQKRPSVLRLKPADRDLLPSVAQHYESFTLSEIEQCLEDAIWIGDLDGVLRIDSTLRRSLVLVARPQPPGPVKIPTPKSDNMMLAEKILKRIDEVLSAGLAPAIACAEAIVAAELQVFAKTVGLDNAAFGNAPPRSIDLRRKEIAGGETSPSWLTRYLGGTQALAFTPLQLPVLGGAR